MFASYCLEQSPVIIRRGGSQLLAPRGCHFYVDSCSYILIRFKKIAHHGNYHVVLKGLIRDDAMLVSVCRWCNMRRRNFTASRLASL